MYDWIIPAGLPIKGACLRSFVDLVWFSLVFLELLLTFKEGSFYLVIRLKTNSLFV
jgi:hypothetical protein